MECNACPYLVLIFLDTVGQILMNVQVELLSVMRMVSALILMVAFTAAVMLDTLEVVILGTAMVCVLY